MVNNLGKTDISSIIERFEAFEERVGVRLDALSAYLEGGSEDSTITVYGELHARNGGVLSRSVDLTLAAYDGNGRVVGRSSTTFDLENFFGFSTFEINIFDLPVGKLSRLRLIPEVL